MWKHGFVIVMRNSCQFLRRHLVLQCLSKHAFSKFIAGNHDGTAGTRVQQVTQGNLLVSCGKAEVLTNSTQVTARNILRRRHLDHPRDVAFPEPRHPFLLHNVLHVTKRAGVEAAGATSGILFEAGMIAGIYSQRCRLADHLSPRLHDVERPGRRTKTEEAMSNNETAARLHRHGPAPVAYVVKAAAMEPAAAPLTKAWVTRTPGGSPSPARPRRPGRRESAPGTASTAR